MERTSSQKFADIYLTTLVQCYVLREYNEQLIDTPVYRQQIKLHSNALAKELANKINTDLDSVFGLEENADKELYKLIDGVDKVAKLLSKIQRPEHFIEIAEMLTEYHAQNEKLTIVSSEYWERRAKAAEDVLAKVTDKITAKAIKSYEKWEKIKSEYKEI